MFQLILAGAAGVALATQPTNGPVVTPVITTTETMSGQTIEVPAHPKVIVTIAVIPPGGILPVHKHPYARYGYLLEGELTATMLASGKHLMFKQGDVLIESRGEWHSAVNTGNVPAKLLVIDQVPHNVKSNVIAKDAAP